VLHIWLFGHLRLARQGDNAALALRPRAQRLLVYLLLHRHQTAYRDRLAFTLWPDLPEKEALATFRRALSEVRAAVPPPPRGEWIAIQADEIRWNSDAPCWLDAAEYEASLRLGTPAGLRRAVELYTGDLLAEFDEPWIDLERAQFREMQFNALRKLGVHERAAGRPGVAAALARRALQLDPLAENAYQDLMLALAAAGDRSAALAEYDQFSRLLREELGIDPLPETRQLRVDIAAGTLATGWGAAAPQPVAPPSQLVGREPEVDILANAWNCARSGRGRCLIMSGEAGVGKTSLSQHLVALAAQQGGLPLTGHCYEFENALPYEALAEMLRAAATPLAQVELPNLLRASLGRIAPAVAADHQPLPGSTSDESRLQLFEGLAQAFLALAHQQPLLLVFEDVHWAAESTLDWLTYFLPRLSANRLLLVITHRSGELSSEHGLHRLRQRFGREGVLTTLLVKPLAREACRAWVAQRSGLDAPYVARLADWLFTETGGNPFFLQELVQGLLEAGQLVVGDAGGWSGPLVQTTLRPSTALPESLRETIAARVGRLAEGTRVFLQVAAVAGRVFDYRIIRAAGEWPEEAALAALDDLLARELVRETEAADGFVFAHHLVQEALFASLATPRRQYWHRRLITAIQQINPWDYAALARHGRAVGDHGLAITHSRLAAREFEKVYAYDEAINHLRTALDLMDEHSSPTQRLEVLEALADNHRLLRQGLPAIEGYQAALALWSSFNQSDHLAALRLQRKIFMVTCSMWETVAADQYDRAAQVCAGLRPRLPDLLAFVEREPPHVEFVAFLRVLAYDALIVRQPVDWDAAHRYSQLAASLAQQLPSPAAMASALDAAVAVYGASGRLHERLEAALSALALTRQAGFEDVHERIAALISAGAALVSLGRFAEALPIIDEGERLAEQVHAFDLQNRALSNSVYAHFRLDRWDAMLAVEAKRRELQRLHRLERLGAPCFSIGLVAAVHRLRGEEQQSMACQTESAEIMSLVSGPLERWGRTQRY
jgi:DNA-binding SARP family transcriptional activator